MNGNAQNRWDCVQGEAVTLIETVFVSLSGGGLYCLLP